MPPRQSVTLRFTASATALLVAVLSIVVPAQPAAAIPPYTMEERAAAIASPALVYLESWVTGDLRLTATGAAVNTTPIVLTYRCTGFVVSPQGHVVTSGHCIQPDKNSYRGTAANALAAERVRAGQLTADQKEAFIKDIVATTEFAGDNLVSAPVVKVYGQLFHGKGSLTKEPAFLAESMQSQGANGGDVAVIKFALTGMPAAQLSPEPLNLDTPVVSLGFATDSPSAAAVYTVRTAPVRITGRYGTKVPQIFQMDKDPGATARGGMIVDSSGRVAGLINADLSTKDRPNTIITNTDHVRAALGGVSAANSLGPNDVAYRAGLDAYFGGRYTEAIEKLDTVIAAVPQHGIAKTYRNQALERRAIEGDAGVTGGGWVVAVIAVMAVALLFCIAAIIWLLVRYRRRKQSSLESYMPISAMPVSGYPISSIPASGGGYAGYEYLPPPVSAPPLDYQQQPMVTGMPDTFSTDSGPSTADGQHRNPWAPPPPER